MNTNPELGPNKKNSDVCRRNPIIRLWLVETLR